MPKTDSSAGRPRRSYQKLTERLRQFMEEGHFRDGDKLPPERGPCRILRRFPQQRPRSHPCPCRKRAPRKQARGRDVCPRADIEPLKEAILEAVDSEGLMFDEVTEYRRIVEPGIAEIAAVRHTSEQLDRLKIIACDQQRRLLVGENDGDLDARFHLALAECTGNKLLIDTVARLNRIYAKGRTPELRDTPWRQFSVSSHLRIIDALERRSPEDSRKALEEHIDTVIHKHLFATVRD